MTKRLKTLDREIFDEMCLGLSYQHDNELTLAIDDLWDWVSKYAKETAETKAPTKQGKKVKEIGLPKLPEKLSTEPQYLNGFLMAYPPSPTGKDINMLIDWATAVTNYLKKL